MNKDGRIYILFYVDSIKQNENRFECLYLQIVIPFEQVSVAGFDQALYHP